jgi:hypothetical protein
MAGGVREVWEVEVNGRQFRVDTDGMSLFGLSEVHCDGRVARPVLDEPPGLVCAIYAAQARAEVDRGQRELWRLRSPGNDR